MIISLFIHSENVQTSNEKEPNIYLLSLKQQSDESDLAMDQAVKDLAENQTNQANQTKKKFALRHPINENLSRQQNATNRQQAWRQKSGIAHGQNLYSTLSHPYSVE